MFFVLLLILTLLHRSYQFYSNADITNFGYTFVPYDNSAQPFLTGIQRTFVRCYAQCNQRIICRTFDFDQDSGQCRLWSDDLTTGSIVAAPSKPQSKVGTVKLTTAAYAAIHKQPCGKCADSRYEICDSTTLTCQCPPMTFWNGTMCLPQRYRYQSCSIIDTCRADLNLECLDTNCNSIYQCMNQTGAGVGVTIAGFCNATVGNGAQGLAGPWGLYVTSDNTLYVADYDSGRVQAYPSLSRFGTTIMTTAPVLEDVFVDSNSNVYVTNLGLSKVYLFPSNITFPKNTSVLCGLSYIYGPNGIAVDRQGNIYVADHGCHMIVKWPPNATTGVLVFGQMNTAGSSNLLLNHPKCIFYDEIANALYVADFTNYRIQKFMINGTGAGVTVAGGYGWGPSLNQLNGPIGVWVSRKDGSIYVSEMYNYRVTKWAVNASQGSIVAGVTQTSGSSSILLNSPGDIALDPTETYLYVADYSNHRVQRFRL